VADVYTGVPTIITAIFSTSVKATIFFTLLRLYNYIIIEKPIMAVICIMSLLVGIFGALQTNKIKRFLAYAAINQMGFIFLGVFTYSTNVVLIYFIFYILTTLMIFIIVLKTINVGTLKLQEIVYISDLKILSFYNPGIRIYLLIILFSMAGLPPFITALTKWYILLVLLNQYYVLLCGISIFLTIFSIYYYVRLIKHIFFEDIALPLINTRPIFYFKNTQNSALFLNLSTFILCFGPVGLYIYIYDFLNFFTKLASFCSLNISTLLLFMLSFINIYGLLLIPLLTIILIYIGNKNTSTKSIVNKENFLIMTFSAGLFLSFIYVLALYFLFKTDTSAYQFVSVISCSLNSFLLINIESLYNVISASLLAIDGLSIVFVILTPFIIFICAAITHQLPTSNTERSLYYIYLLLMELFLFLAFTTTNLLIFYFAFEATLLPIFLIIGRWGSNASKKQAANYIFLYTVAGSVLMLFAILSIITYSGTANFLALKSIITFQNSTEFSFW
jgi:NADH:ubiquinone oxidoreductase subunit 2 (subunit N)